MTNISRPFQIALAALVLFIAVWFVALRGHSGGESSSSSSSAPSSASSSSSSQPSASQSAPGGGTPASKGGVYHGSAPGVEGLSRAIQKARGAVAQSEQTAKQQSSAQSSSATQKQNAQSQTQGAQKQNAQTQTSQTSSARQTQAQQNQSQQAQNSQHSKAAAGVPAMQATVESELKSNRTVIVLFWSPKGAVDRTVRHQLSLLQSLLEHSATLARNRNIAVHYSSAGEVGRYGSITRSLQVYSTPTMLVIAPHGSTKTLTGLVDAYTIRQAIKEARTAQA
jgi:FtsZ-interacting cell division protein ZipA